MNPHHSKKILLTIVYLLFIPQWLISQDLHYQHFTTENGLPSSQVYDIIQDDWGYLWFSTDHGLSRYNGYSFENYSTQDGLSNNTVFNFRKLTNGTIWCSTFNRSLFSIQGETPVFKPYPYNEILIAVGMDAWVTTSFYFSPQGDLYMSLSNASGFIHLDGKGKVVSNTLSMNTKTQSSSCLVSDPKGNDFFFFEQGEGVVPLEEWASYIKITYPIFPDFLRAVYLSQKKTAVFAYNYHISIISEEEKVTEVKCDHQPIGLGVYQDSLFWVGFRYGGIKIYNTKGKLIRHFLPEKSVTSCCRDHEGGLWISTLHHGVYYIKNVNIQCIDFPDKREKWVHRIAKDQQGEIYVSMYNGDVYHLYNSAVELIHESISERPAIVEADHKGNRVVYNSDERIYQIPEKPRPYLRAFGTNFSFAGTDSILITSYSGIHTIHSSGFSNVKLNHRPLDLLVYNNRWVVATLVGLMLWNNEQLLPIGGNTLRNMRIEDLELFGTRLALGTHGSGVVLINRDSTLLRIGEKDGLKSDFISKLYAENDSILWVCTYAGISRIDLQKDQIRIKNISTSDGLLSNEITDIEITNDKIWVGTTKGLCYFSKSFIHEVDETVNNNFLRFTKICINDSARNIQPTYTLRYNENRLEVDYQAISFRNGDELIYRYRLSGLEGNWNYTIQRKAIYPSIPPGRYQFEVQSLSADGSWNTLPIKMDVQVKSPFWNTWWFRLSLITGVIILIYLFFRFRILSYNRDITRELLRQLLKKLRRNEKYVIFREQGKDVRIPSSIIAYVKSSGNYMEIYTEKGRHIVRSKIGEFLERVPDPLEYLRIHRSYIIRLDKLEQKGIKEVVVMGEKLSVGETYLKDVQKIQF